MLPRARGTIVFCFCFTLALLVCSAERVESQQSNVGVSNVLLRENVSQSHRRELTEKLRRITGWSNLAFDTNGALQAGSGQAEGGSQSARALVHKAITGARVIIVEDVSNRGDVAFGSVTPGRWLRNAGYRPQAYVVMIDFADFRQLIGDKQAREAFDAGWAMLHELDHAVNDSKDSTEIGEAGDCEDHINLMRRELKLPERTEYFHTLLPVTSDSRNFPTRFVRLAFETRDSGDKRKRYWLMWDAAVVGGSRESKALAAVK
jgi:orotate phosphoribosyltransferase